MAKKANDTAKPKTTLSAETPSADNVKPTRTRKPSADNVKPTRTRKPSADNVKPTRTRKPSADNPTVLFVPENKTIDITDAHIQTIKLNKEIADSNGQTCILFRYWFERCTSKGLSIESFKKIFSLLIIDGLITFVVKDLSGKQTDLYVHISSINLYDKYFMKVRAHLRKSNYWFIR